MKGALGWLFQRLTGILLAVGLLLHFSVMHFSGQQQVTYEMVLKRISNPLWKAFDFFFLGLILFHGFNGLWGMALEYLPSRRLLKLFRGLIVVSVCALLVTGIFIIAL